ncbi:phosphotransferase family protein [Alkalicoccobacillus porphyridii]|uniref:Aminoglycoside phosphotransferase family protein n=1 Tax=Alkalicoccobacillus porphyridii TaxID=2597270 RepID=A0A553ZXE5_9BACI|nr:aminoglycoside phosphotransferase family protein [Alkalicoccobacillus porphyridii]TSB46128.1 aminoglycoside phosphotransferase family protein [Alkalicoccobacillus porphyridii]
MKSFKMNVSDSNVSRIIRLNYPYATNIEQLNMGELSRVYTFKAGDSEYVAHFRLTSESLKKAKMIYERFGDTLPIPEVLDVGELDGIHFMFSQKANGKPITSFDGTTQASILQHLATVYSDIVKTEIDHTFGWISPSGQATYDTWSEALESFFVEEDHGFHANWKQLFDGQILEKQAFDDGYTKMMELSTYAPQKSYLVHGDFHLGNMLSDGQLVTGIVDWEMSMQGDFVFDLAGLHFWAPELNFPEKMKAAWNKQGIDIPHFHERLYATLLFKATDGLRFYAKQENMEAYQFIKNKLYQLLNEL